VIGYFSGVWHLIPASSPGGWVLDTAAIGSPGPWTSSDALGFDPTSPCNPATGDAFYDGGHETFIFTDIQGSTAFGTYDDGSAVTLTLLPYDMAELVDGRQDELLCGLRFGLLAPPATCFRSISWSVRRMS
jgi:hypothetical protein